MILNTMRPRKFYGLLLSSYIICGVILISLSFLIVHKYFLEVTKEEMENSNDMLIASFQSDMDAQLRAMNDIARLINSDANFISSLERSGYTIYMAEKKLQSYVTINQNLLTLSVIDTNRNEVISPAGKMSTQKYFNSYYRFEGTSTEELMKTISTATKPILTNLQQIKMYDTLDPKRCALYIYPISAATKVVFLIDDKFFTRCFNKYFTSGEGGFYILDANFNVLSGICSGPWEKQGKSVVATKDVEELEAPFQKIFTSKDKTEQVILLNAGYNNWNYCILTSTENYVSRSAAIQRIFLFSLIATLFVSVLLSILFSRFTYRPIKQLRQKTMELNYQPLNQELDEFSFISKQFVQLVEKNTQMSERVREQQALYINHMMVSFLHGTTNAEKFESLMRQEGIQLHYSFFRVAVVQVEKVQDEAEQFAAYRIVSNTLPQESVRVLISYYQNQGLFVLLLNYEEEKQCQGSIQYLNQKFTELFGCGISIGVGNVQPGLSKLRQSFLQSLTALGYSGLSTQSIRYITDIDNSCLDIMETLSEVRYNLILKIKQGDQKGAEQDLSMLFDQIADNNIAKFVYANLISDLLILAKEAALSLEIDNVDLYIADPAVNPGVLKQYCLELTGQLCDEVNQAKNNPEARLGQSILFFVDDHFMDSNLSVDAVADEFQISSFSCNKLVKSITGSSFTAYLDQKRMKRAKELLTFGDMQVKKIVTEVGYVDVNNFIRKFKKSEGMTPVQYRSQFKV